MYQHNIANILEHVKIDGDGHNKNSVTAKADVTIVRYG